MQRLQQKHKLQRKPWDWQDTIVPTCVTSCLDTPIGEPLMNMEKTNCRSCCTLIVKDCLITLRRTEVSLKISGWQYPLPHCEAPLAQDPKGINRRVNVDGFQADGNLQIALRRRALEAHFEKDYHQVQPDYTSCL